MDTQLLYVAQRMQNYFQRIASLSQGARPPGVNAANGWFREWMVNDSEIARCAEPPTLNLSGDADLLFDAYTYFYAVFQRAFRDNGNVAAGVNAGEVVLDNLGAVVGTVMSIVDGVGSVIGGGNAAEAIARVGASIKALADSIASSGKVLNGAHANGWIAAYARDAAVWTMENQLKPAASQLTTPEGKHIADIFARVCDGLARLPTDRHNPWLRAEWQIGCQAIAETAVAALGTLTAAQTPAAPAASPKTS